MLKEIEQLRKQCKRTITGTNLICVLMVVVALIYDFGYSVAVRHSLTPILLVVAFVVMMVTHQRQSAVYVDEFRAAFLNHLFDKRIHLNFIEYGKGIDRYDMKEWGVLKEADHWFTRDLIEGNCFDTEFRMSFAQASKDHEMIGQNAFLPQTIQIFSGSYLMAKLKTPVQGRVYGSSDLLEVLTLKEKTFDAVFHLRYEGCNVSDVLTDDLKEKMMRIHQKHSGVAFGIVDGWLHVIVPGYTSFAAPSLSSEVNPDLIMRMEKQMQEINDLILMICE